MSEWMRVSPGDCLRLARPPPLLEVVLVLAEDALSLPTLSLPGWIPRFWQPSTMSGPHKQTRLVHLCSRNDEAPQERGFR
jgi:hypothetical protein